MHNIHYIICAENADRKRIMAEITRHAQRDGDGYSSRFTWHDNIPPYESEESAREAIRRFDNGWYDDHAVRFMDYSKAKKTAKIAEYESKIKELMEALEKYKKEHSIHAFQAKLIGCEKCGSKLNKSYITGNACPLCRTDLRSKTTLEKIKWYEAKIEEYRKRIRAEEMKQKKNAVVKWLIKYEYHS